MFLKVMKKPKDNYETILLIAIMEIQWNKLGNKFEQHDLGIANQLINFLKGVLTNENELMFVQSCRTLSSLMQALGQIKNPFAPLIYKILVTTYGLITDSSRVNTFLSRLRSFLITSLSVSKEFQGCPEERWSSLC